MLFTIGYQGKGVDFFLCALKRYWVKTLLDVRSKPYSRIACYNKNALKKLLEEEGVNYKWVGDKLGGLRDIREEEIKRLAEWQNGRVACLMCMEANPFACHRHNEIGRRLRRYGVNVSHIVMEGKEAIIERQNTIF